MVDAGVRRFRDDGLGVKGDAEASFLDHAEIVRAVPDRQRVVGRELALLAQGDERLDLGAAAENGLSHFPRKSVVREEKRVRAVEIEADRFRDAFGEEGKAARDERAGRAMRAHGRGERAAPRRLDDALAIDLFQRGERQALEQSDTLLQRRLEGDLAAHRALGDRGDLRLDAEFGGELVDAFLLDDRRVHVGDEELLLAVARRLDRKVDARSGEVFAD